MGTQKLGLGPDSSFDSEDNLERAKHEAIEKSSDRFGRLLDSRFGWLVLPFGLSVFFFFCDWGGYRGKWQPWGDPKPLADIWWHFPLLFVGSAVLIYFGFIRKDRR